MGRLAAAAAAAARPLWVLCSRAVISLCTLCAAACIADCLPHALLPPQVGTCDALTGLCTCQAGWQGFNCLMPLPRHCAVRYSSFGYERGRHEANLSMGIGWGSIFGFPESHCAGGCWTAARPGCMCPALLKWASPGQVAGQAGRLVVSGCGLCSCLSPMDAGTRNNSIELCYCAASWPTRSLVGLPNHSALPSPMPQARATKASRCATAPPTQVTAASPRRRMPLQVAFV